MEDLRRKAEEHLLRHIRQLDLDWAGAARAAALPSGITLEARKGILGLQAALRHPEPAGLVEADFEEDDTFLYVPVRALSAVVIEDYWVDFSNPAVLEEAAPKLSGVPVFPNHDVDVLKWLGVVKRSWYDDGATPPGIDAVLALDKQMDRVVRGVKLGALQSVSITAWFDWQPSHPDMHPAEFFLRLGEEVDGERVRIVVTRIRRFGEISLVWSGADPHAKVKIRAGGETMENLDHLRREVESLRTQLAELTPFAELGKRYLEDIRAATRQAYLRLKGEKARKEILQMLDRADMDTLLALKQEYEDALRETFQGTCPHCGGKIPAEIRSSVGEDAPPIPEVAPDAYRVS
ncbi:MAG: hypothetical protein L3J76_01895 [Candidatus Hydrothermae bacterium]|nr:hypothetical protein [Candidatus Hydrothermae bacterium]